MFRRNNLSALANNAKCKTKIDDDENTRLDFDDLIRGSEERGTILSYTPP